MKDANSALGRELELLRATERAAAARIAGFDVSYFGSASFLPLSLTDIYSHSSTLPTLP